MSQQVTFPFTLKQYAAYEKGGELVAHETVLQGLKPHEILLEVLSCGICRSDVHLHRNDWGFSSFPQVFGHEIVGRVIAKGASADKFAVGDRVAVGWQAGSCMSCHECLTGSQALCDKSEGSPTSTRGGFAFHTYADERFAFKVPENLDSTVVGPLLCGGITVMKPIYELTRPGDAVGVIGVGGLGHLAIKFARAVGCEAVAFTSSADKVQALKDMGAHRVIVTTNAAEMAAASASPALDLILNTLDIEMDVGSYLGMLRKKGKFVFLGCPPQANFHGGHIFGQMISAEKVLTGSMIGSPAIIEAMLKVCELHNIGATVEVFPHTKINEAMKHTADGKARFRTVVQFKAE
jgi:uncharacterized zinc-type alcohol dehydrogenase-like protein